MLCAQIKNKEQRIRSSLLNTATAVTVESVNTVQYLKGGCLSALQAVHFSVYVRHKHKCSQQSCEFGIIESVTIPTSCAQQEVTWLPGVGLV